MTAIDTNPLPKLAAPVPFRWTREDYHNAARAGVFVDRRVQLLDGEVVEMAPQGQPHVIAVSFAYEILRGVFATGYWVRSQSPIRIGDGSEPEPDVSVVTGSAADYPVDAPDTAVLVVEVSDTTLEVDRRRKARAYASAGIPDYWIVNLVDRRLEVYRLSAGSSAAGYGPPTILLPSDQVSPLGAPGASIAIARLLP